MAQTTVRHIFGHRLTPQARRAAGVLLIFVCGWLGWVAPLVVMDRPACGMECCLEGDGECCYFRGPGGAESGQPDDGLPSRREAQRDSAGAACPVNCLLTAGYASSSSRQTGLPVDSLALAGVRVDPRSFTSCGEARPAAGSPSIPRAPPSSII